MSGNLWECCNEVHNEGFGGGRVMRGGSFYSDSNNVRSAFRGNGGPSDQYFGVGFRLVRTK